MAGALHGVSASDPFTYLGVASVLGLTGLVACSIPAWRAATTQPLSALRSD
jgi:ABC-type lipoprotein release transport system permease subunit